MGGVKHMLDEVAQRMEITDPNDPRVRAEVDRLLSIQERRLVVLETHPNSGGCWVGKMGTAKEIMDYLRDLANNHCLEYVGGILELRERAEEEMQDWLELENCQPVRIHVRPPLGKGDPTPPLPGLEKRLAGIQVEAYGQKRSVWSILQAMTDNQIADTFGQMLADCLQYGLELPEPEGK